MWDQVVFDNIQLDKNDFSILDIKVDLITSLEEFLQIYKTGNDYYKKKSFNRIFRELFFYTTEKRLLRDVDVKICLNSLDQNFSIWVEKILVYTEKLINFLKIEAWKDIIRTNEMSHKLMRTLEKVRWELISSYWNIDYFDNWRNGKWSFLWFNPRQIGWLLSSFTEENNVVLDESIELWKQLISITRSKVSHEILNGFHDVFTSWVTKSMDVLYNQKNDTNTKKSSFVLPSLSEDWKNIISRIWINKWTRFVKTEHLATKLFSTKRIVNFRDKKNFYLVDIIDFLGNTATDCDIKENLWKFVDFLHKIHSIPLDKFWRLWDYGYNSYYEYLFGRINYSDLTKREKIPILDYLDYNKNIIVNKEPVLCNMDAWLRNVIMDDWWEIRLIDFEHASWCVKERDIQRVYTQLPQELKKIFISEYYSNLEQSYNREVNFITRNIQQILFANNIKNIYIKKYYLNKIKNILNK